MKSTFHLYFLLTQLTLCLGIIACTPVQAPPVVEEAPPAPTPPVAEDLSYTVLPGDTLRAIAVLTTGDSRNWQPIALRNNLTPPYPLYVGQELEIPGRLLFSEPDNVVPPSSISGVEGGAPAASASSPSAVPKRQRQPVKKTQPAPKERPLQDGPPEDVLRAERNSSGWLMITGSYYPREIKVSPNSGADYLMLVRPGSRMRYVGRQGIWYKVVTERGEGYVESDYIEEQ